jgi:uncharacterized protein YecT (DUF1311 family)
MEVIKRVNARLAWVKVDDTEARLMTFEKDKTTAQMIAEGQKIKDKRNRLKQIQEEIKRLKRQ